MILHLENNLFALPQLERTVKSWAGGCNQRSSPSAQSPAQKRQAIQQLAS